MSPVGRTPPRRSVTGEILGWWVIAAALVPFVLPVVLLADGHVTAAMLIWGIVIMTVLALARGSASSSTRPRSPTL
jgi:hypothetical protein